MFALSPCYLYIYCSQVTLLQQKRMKLQIMTLAVALVTISGPAAATVYTACELARVLPQCGLNFNISDCKFTTASANDFN